MQQQVLQPPKRLWVTVLRFAASASVSALAADPALDQAVEALTRPLTPDEALRQRAMMQTLESADAATAATATAAAATTAKTETAPAAAPATATVTSIAAETAPSIETETAAETVVGALVRLLWARLSVALDTYTAPKGTYTSPANTTAKTQQATGTKDSDKAAAADCDAATDNEEAANDREGASLGALLRASCAAIADFARSPLMRAPVCSSKTHANTSTDVNSSSNVAQQQPSAGDRGQEVVTVGMFLAHHIDVVIDGCRLFSRDLLTLLREGLQEAAKQHKEQQILRKQQQQQQENEQQQHQQQQRASLQRQSENASASTPAPSADAGVVRTVPIWPDASAARVPVNNNKYSKITADSVSAKDSTLDSVIDGHIDSFLQQDLSEDDATRNNSLPHSQMPSQSQLQPQLQLQQQSHL